MFYSTYLEFHNRHEMYMLSLMNKIVLLAVHHGDCFAEEPNCQYQSISNTALSYALGLNTISLFIFLLGNLMIFDYQCQYFHYLYVQMVEHWYRKLLNILVVIL